MQRYGFDMLEAVSFRAHKYGEEIARLLAMHGNGEMEMPLIRPALGVGSARAALEGRSAVALFPEGRAPEAALAGLYLYFGCWDEAHQHADAAETRENYYWHAIVHRQEPDAWNAGYWFRKTGSHAIFPALVRGSARGRLWARTGVGSDCLHRILRGGTAGLHQRSFHKRRHSAARATGRVAASVRLLCGG